MSMTIKQIADELGVSKTAVRNYMTDEFRAKYTEKDCKGVILVSAEGCKLIAESLGKTENERKESAESEFVTIPRSVWRLMEDQIREKDAQLRVKDQQIAALTKLADQAQKLQAMQEQKLLPQPQKGFFSMFRKKGDDHLENQD